MQVLGGKFKTTSANDARDKAREKLFCATPPRGEKQRAWGSQVLTSCSKTHNSALVSHKQTNNKSLRDTSTRRLEGRPPIRRFGGQL